MNITFTTKKNYLMSDILVSLFKWSPFTIPRNATTKSRDDKQQRLSGNLSMRDKSNMINEKRNKNEKDAWRNQGHDNISLVGKKGMHWNYKFRRSFFHKLKCQNLKIIN